jgi:hypothetical protein
MRARKRAGPRDITMACVAAMAVNDRATINRLDADFSRLTPEQIFGALGDLGQMIKPALKHEQHLVMRKTIEDEVKVQPLSQAVQAAVISLTGALLIDADTRVFAAEFTNHVTTIQEDMTSVAMGCVMATASVVGRLDIKLDFK